MDYGLEEKLSTVDCGLWAIDCGLWTRASRAAAFIGCGVRRTIILYILKANIKCAAHISEPPMARQSQYGPINTTLSIKGFASIHIRPLKVPPSIKGME